MRHVATLLLLGVALTAGAAEIWRWTDANGVVHYSDHPVPGATRMSVDPAPKPSGSGPLPAAPAPAPARDPAPATAPAALYMSCNITSPGGDETFHSVQPVSVQVNVQPALRAGHRIQVFMNGTPRTDWPANSPLYTLPEVTRGSHTLQARVVDESGNVVCSAPPVTFHLRQQSVLPPANPAPGAGSPRPGNPRPTPRPLPTVPGA